MKKSILLMIALFMVFSCGKKEIPITAYTIEQFYKNESIGGGSFSPDEKYLLVTSNRTGIFNAYALPVDGTEIIPLTKSTSESVWAISYFPADDRILYASDSGGNEIDHIYVRNTDSTVSDLTPWSNAKSQFYGWSRDEKSFFFASNKRNPQFFDLYEMSIDKFESKMVYQNDEGLDVGAISNNKKTLVLIKPITSTNSEMYLYDVASKKMKHITQHEGDASYNPQFFDMADQYLYYLTDEGVEFTFLERYNLATGTKEKVFEDAWDVAFAYESWNSKYRVVGINSDARTVIKITELATGAEVNIPGFEGKDLTGVSIPKSENLMKFVVASSKMPSDIFVYDFNAKTSKKLTSTLNPEINPDHLVEGRVIRYKSFDGLDIPAVYYQPLQASEKNKVPGLVWVHGGPGGQSRLGYFSLIQYLVNHGYAVLAVNNRGSSGYGKTFFKMDDQKHGDLDLKDCVYGKEFFAATGVVDPEKIGIIGGSYGGYMVMAALAFEPEAFDVGVNIFGVTNWLRTLKSIPPWWESFRDALYKEMGDPYTADSVRLYNISPLFHAKNVTKPLLVLQGANDPRVLQAESDEIVAGVKANGVPVEYVLFPDEGHGFVKKENEIKGYGQVLEFLDTYLKKVEKPS